MKVVIAGSSVRFGPALLGQLCLVCPLKQHGFQYWHLLTFRKQIVSPGGWCSFPERVFRRLHSRPYIRFFVRL
jgi:hypothetical protein